MKKISRSSWYSKAFMILWCGGVVLFMGIAWVEGAVAQSLMFVLVPVLMLILAYIYFNHFIRDLIDDVYDEGDSLLFRKGDKEQRVFLKDIVNINHRTINALERIEIQVRTDGELGKLLAFTPPMRMNHLVKPPIVTDLIERVDNERHH